MLDHCWGWQPAILEVARTVYDNQNAKFVTSSLVRTRNIILLVLTIPVIISRAYLEYNTTGTNHTPAAINRHQCNCKTGWRTISYQQFCEENTRHTTGIKYLCFGDGEFFSIPSVFGAWGKMVDWKWTKVPNCCTYDRQKIRVSRASASYCWHNLFSSRQASCILCLVSCWSAELSYHKQSHLPVVGARGAEGQAQSFILPVPLPKLLCPLLWFNAKNKVLTAKNAKENDRLSRKE